MMRLPIFLTKKYPLMFNTSSLERCKGLSFKETLSYIITIVNS